MAFIDLLNPENIIRLGGLALLLFIIFAETGLFFGFFLPGDSLVFIAGMLSGTKYLDVSVPVLIVLLIVAAVAGSTVGYLSGRWASNYFHSKQDSLFYKRRYLEIAREFYARHGAMAFILGRFLPVIRTFVTIAAGVVKIDMPKFMLFNFLGASIWIATFVILGHWLGNVFPNLINYIELVVAGLIIVSAIPVVVAWYRKPAIKDDNKINSGPAGVN